MLLSSLSTTYQTRGLLLTLSPTLAVVSFLLSVSRIVSLLLVLSPLVLLVVLDILECQQLKRDLEVPYQLKPGTSARAGREKLQKLLPKKTGKRYLIVGTGGVGRRLLTLLQQRGEAHVYGFDLCDHSKIEDVLNSNHFVKGNVTSLASCQEALQRVKPDVVFHTAAVLCYSQRKKSQWDPCYQVNVQGVSNMLQAATEAKVKSFILTSSSTAGLSRRDLHQSVSGSEERFPPQTSKTDALSWYTLSKALAETESLQYCVDNTKAPLFGIIRPASGIFHHLDRFCLEVSFNDMNTSAIGFERSVCDWVYVDNVALGHLLLEKQLNAGKCQNETFIISNQDPMVMYDLFRRMQTSLVPGFVYWKLSSTLVFLLATFTEVMTSLGASVPHELSLLSYTTLALATVDYTMDDSKAQQMLGYQPAFTTDEAILQCMEDHQKHFPQGELAKVMRDKKQP